MRTKTLTTICLLVMLTLWGCGNKPEPPGSEAKKEGEPMAAGEIINRYVETLTTATDKARAAGAAVEKRTRDTEESIGD